MKEKVRESEERRRDEARRTGHGHVDDVLAL